MALAREQLSGRAFFDRLLAKAVYLDVGPMATLRPMVTTFHRVPRSAPVLARRRTAVHRTSFGHYFGDSPRGSVVPFEGPRHTLEVMERAALGPRGEQSLLVRQFTEYVVKGLWPKDYLSEILAIRNVFLQPSPWNGKPLVRYTNDPRHVELVKDPERLVHEINTDGSTIADCDEIACLAGTMALTLGREVEWVALGFAPNSLSHVGVRVKEPKSNHWIWLDAVAGPREREAAERAQTVAFWSLD